MKDYDGKRIPLRMRWEAFTQDMREEIAIHGVRHLGVEWFSHYWYKGVTSPWLRSPLGSFIRKSRGYDEVVRHCQGYVCDMRDLRVEVRQLRENRDLLREALQIGFAERQDKLELLLVDAEVNIRMRESEPF
jgi:hypothetical protein